MNADTPPIAAVSPSFVHATASFQFLIDAPLSRAAPLFGGEGERAWAGDEWNPQFLYPSEPRDTEGAVFTLEHDRHTSVWVNTRFDLTNGRMQYVVFLPNLMTTTIDVQLTPRGRRTEVHVSYTRTALSPTANEHVAALSAEDAEKGAQWEKAIAKALSVGNDR